jgi:hypothetical protein
LLARLDRLLLIVAADHGDLVSVEVDTSVFTRPAPGLPQADERSPRSVRRR